MPYENCSPFSPCAVYYISRSFLVADKTVDLLQYANVSITGESGDAEADIMIDYNGLGRELFGKDKNQTAFDEATVEYSLGNDLVYTVDPEDGIFNGDTVTLTVTASDSFLKKHDIKLASTSKEIKVSGLEESGTPAKADDNASESNTATPLQMRSLLTRSTNPFSVL